MASNPSSVIALLSLFLIFLVAFLGAIASVPAISRIAVSRRLLDYPDGQRRLHAQPVPRLGGVAVFIGFFVALACGVAFRSNLGWTPSDAHFGSIPLAIAIVILFAVGLLDDLHGVPPVLKIIAQTAAAVVVFHDGFAIRTIAITPAHVVHLGIWAFPVTAVWLVGLSNAFNLVDGLDGLAGGVGIIALLAIAASSMALGYSRVPAYAIALAGALGGFLRFNWAPARIFLGDSGSLVVGFLLAFLSIKGATRPDGSTLIVVPIFALSYPLLDTGIAIMRRWLRGDPLSRADGRHIHHQLRALGLSSTRAACVVYVESASVAILGLLVVFGPPTVAAGVVGAGFAILLFILVVGLRLLDYHEFSEAGMLVVSGAARMRGAIRDTITARDVALLLVRSESLDEVNTYLSLNAEKLGYSSMAVGTTRSLARDFHRASNMWKFEYPLVNPSATLVVDPSGDAIILAIYCAPGARLPSASVERVAHVLATAISASPVAQALAPVSGRHSGETIRISVGKRTGSRPVQR